MHLGDPGPVPLGDAVPAPAPRARVQLVRKDVPLFLPTCPVSTEGGTRRVQIVREGGGGGATRKSRTRACKAPPPFPTVAPTHVPTVHSSRCKAGEERRFNDAGQKNETRTASRPGGRRATSLVLQDRWMHRTHSHRTGSHGKDPARVPTCPVSTEGGTRRVQIVREGGGGGRGGTRACTT
jgi:hypothetical protein